MSRRSAVFLDRDGTLIEDVGYLADPDRIALIPGTPEALRSFMRASFALVVVSNQAGVARGLYTEDDVRAVNVRLSSVLAEEGVRLDAFYHCPHHPDFTGPCDCRKPGTAMLTRAVRDLGLDSGSSWMIGDHVSDVEAAGSLGIPAILVLTGHGIEEAERLPTRADVRLAADLPAAARIVLGK